MKREKYLKEDGKACPYCNQKKTMVAGDLNVDDYCIWRDIHCTACEGTWVDVYVLHDIL